MRRCAALCAGVGTLAVLTACSGTPQPGSVASSSPSTSATSVPAPAASVPPAGPLGSSEYQAELSRIDQVLAGPMQRLTRVRTAEGLADAMNTLADSLDTVSARLAALTVSSRLSTVHELLQDRLGVAALSLSNTAKTEEDARCGGVAYTSRKVQRQLRTDLNGAIVALQKLKLTFGRTLPDPGPEPAIARPSNGDLLVRRGAEGTGRLEIINGTAKDVAVSIVSNGQPPGKPQVMAYIRAGKTVTVHRIGGAYHIYFKSGADWNPSRRQFSADCAFQKFDQTFGRNQGWKINLRPVPGGNAKTTQVEAY